MPELGETAGGGVPRITITISDLKNIRSGVSYGAFASAAAIHSRFAIQVTVNSTLSLTRILFYLRTIGWASKSVQLNFDSLFQIRVRPTLLN